MASPSSLTQYLLSRYTSKQQDPQGTSTQGASPDKGQQLWENAVQHPFLRRAGQGTLPDAVLAEWLAQDIHYTRAYVRFIGGLLSQLRLPMAIDPATGAPGVAGASSSSSSGGRDQGRGKKNLTHRAFDVLVSALGVIQTEMQFFEDTVAKYGLLETFSPETLQIRRDTKAYVDLLDAAGRAPLVEGLAVLWATELAYLEAWSFAKSQTKHASAAGSSTRTASGAKAQGEIVAETGGRTARARAALHEAFIPNWTTPEFGKFVDELKDLLDELAVQQQIQIPPAAARRDATATPSEAPADDGLNKIVDWFDQIVWLEARFWPDVD